ncbi:N-acetylmuramic acid 6-phosphate etherase [Leptotrichia sp. oral taxon 847]|uniref:N-acetylmuramic acid 6-phosphate etherase n=1 Tax=Leptotrichia sp. oral taxon 847 TaxID=1785996 RepID=UPI000768034D|nr:N-acetylmuramic acid 6-phosphate etherase [Leptotrichia sp. oral taxon 847]AMD95259.1 N-acetylmuramic acid 6-phosphate etherase [Leptotrichia sp. oral taxon 847]
MLENLTTERRNKKTENLDELSTKEILRIMNEEDKTVPAAIEKELGKITEAIEIIKDKISRGGRLIYLGAGTSGRLGILDAVECVPTFNTTDEVLGIIAGGEKAFVKAVEGAEDSLTLAQEDLKKINFSRNDVIFGIAASGRTPYVIGALKYAESVGAKKITLSCNKNAKISKYADVAIEIDCGPEILTGSTRLKAGTAQKLVLNMVSTATMIGLGKVYKNLMVDVKPTNKKLVERATGIIAKVTGVTGEEAHKYLLEANKNVKVAITMILTNCSYKEAKEKLGLAKGFVKKVK